MSALTNVFFRLERAEDGDFGVPNLRLRVAPALSPAPGMAGLVELSELRELGWPLTVGMTIENAAQGTGPGGGTFHVEGYANYAWEETDGTTMVRNIEHLRAADLKNACISGQLSLHLDWQQESVTIPGKDARQQLAISGTRLEVARAAYVMATLRKENDWTLEWRTNDAAVPAIKISPGGARPAPTLTAWVVLVRQELPGRLPDGRVPCCAAYSLSSREVRFLDHMQITWQLSQATAKLPGLAPYQGGDLAQLQVKKQTPDGWLLKDNVVTVKGLETITYVLGAA